jgi:hypothetical protein
MRRGMMMVAVVALLTVGCGGAEVLAQGYTYQTIDAQVPGLGWTRITGLTTLGSMVGTAFDNEANEYSWLYRRNTKKFEVVKQKGYPNALVADMNDQQRMCGTYFKGTQYLAFVRYGGVLTTLRVPGAVESHGGGISNTNLVVGSYQDARGGWHAFTYDVIKRVYTTIDVPGALLTSGHGVNNHGHLVGEYFALPGGTGSPGWLLRDGVFTRIDAPCGGSWTSVHDINDDGLMAVLCGDGDGRLVSYAYDGETWTELAVPGAFVTEVRRVNNTGQLVGWYMGQDGKDHGFIATPYSPPASR